MNNPPRIAVIIPAFRVRDHILSVLSKIDKSVQAIYIVDDGCPENTGQFVMEHFHDSRIQVIFNTTNKGVGGAVLLGFQQASQEGNDILVKLDGDGQIDPSYLYKLIQPIMLGRADYAKGNRFYQADYMHSMPWVRLLGNAGLSFLTKLSSGYWNIADPTHGFIAIPNAIFTLLPHAKIDQRYFFESDLLFRLNLIRAVVVDVPIPIYYGNEKSNLNPFKEFFRFGFKNVKNTLKRIIYSYFIRDFNVASLQLIISSCLLNFGAIFGVYHWILSRHTPSTAGTVMLAALPIILGVQLFLSFLSYDISMVPRDSLQKQASCD